MPTAFTFLQDQTSYHQCSNSWCKPLGWGRGQPQCVQMQLLVSTARTWKHAWVACTVGLWDTTDAMSTCTHCDDRDVQPAVSSYVHW